jgi:glycopeptide antibiotics resistance protein
MAVTATAPRHVAAATTMANMVIVFLLIISVDVMQCIALVKYADKCDVILLL